MKTLKSPYTWELNDDVHSCSYEHQGRGKVNLGTVKELEDGFACYTITNFDGDHLTCFLPTLEIAKCWVEGSGHRKYCRECKELHENISFCEGCGMCLYKNSEWIPDDTYPFFRCTECNKVNFWD